MGMNHAGEIRELAAIARPDIGVVTNVGYAHVEFFDSIEGVAAAKRELIEGLPPDGVAVLNADDARVARFARGPPRPLHHVRLLRGRGCARRRMWSSRAAGSRFRALGVDFESPLTGRHAVMNLLAAIAVARVFEIAPERLREAVAQLRAWARCAASASSTAASSIWNDCYNSNPEAAQSMLDVLRETPAARRIAVLGEMLELGHAAEELHRQVGRYAAEHGRGSADRRTRRGARHGGSGARRPASEARVFRRPGRGRRVRARRLARPGDAVLFKGSRGVRVERALERFTGVAPMLYFLALRTALPVRQPVPRLPLHHLPHRVRQPDGAVPLHRARALADRQAARISDRPVHPRRRTASRIRKRPARPPWAAC